MKYGLVIEGGSRKGLFTAGVLDAIMQEDIQFQYAIGVSAGAHGAINFVSHQPKRLKQVLSPSAIRDNKKAHLLLDGPQEEFHKMTFDYSYDPKNPFDFDAFSKSKMECEVCATCAETGTPVFFEERKDEDRLLKIVSASCSLPMIFPIVEIDGLHFADGCVSDSVPYDRALDKGCDKIVIVSTKVPGDEPVDFRRMNFILSPLYRRRYPNLYNALLNRYDDYQAQQAKIDKLEKQGKIYIIKPEQELCDLFEVSPEKIDKAYNHGFDNAMRHMNELRAFLNMPLQMKEESLDSSGYSAADLSLREKKIV